jgi:CheY-like chemotaxis protein
VALKSLKILIVDDMDASRLELGQLVEQRGHACCHASSGDEALALLDSFCPDLVLLDLLMPGLNGFEVCIRLRERVTDRWLPVIVMSGLEGEEHFIHALSQGADDFLTRPISPRLLDAKLSHYGRVLGLQERAAHMAARHASIFENIADAVLIVGPDACIREANHAARSLWTRNQDVDPVGERIHSIFVEPMELPGPGVSMGVRAADGRTIPMSVSVSHWSMGGEDLSCWVLHDQSEEKKIQRMKDEFLATVSHELRTPLTSILGALGLLSAGVVPLGSKQGQHLLGVAKRNGERLNELVDDVLDLAKLEGDRMVLKQQDVSLIEVVRDAVSVCEAMAKQAQVELKVDAPTITPQVSVDASRFVQVLVNLISNAVKFSPSGESVDVQIQSDPYGACVCVRDRGPGIPVDQQNQLFEKFSQLDGSDSRSQGGTGLGLYISKMLIEKMGGYITVTSPVGPGAEFSVYVRAYSVQGLAP